MADWDRIRKRATAWYQPAPRHQQATLPPEVRNAASFGGRASTGDVPVGTVTTCAQCGQEREVREAGSGRYVLRYWSDCACITRQIAEAEAARQAATDRAANLGRERLVAQLGLSRVHGFTLDTFDPARLAADDDASHPLTYALRWLDGVRGESAGDYHQGPPPALYFSSRGKGRGKTHLAAGMAWRAYEWGYLSAFVEETSYLSRYWAEDFETRDELQTLLGDRSWLTVIDDLGQTPPARKEGGTAKAWYDILNRRWLRRGWTIITSNRTLDELAEQGTINDATYSRVYQMTRGQMVEFDGTDYRLERV